MTLERGDLSSNLCPVKSFIQKIDVDFIIILEQVIRAQNGDPIIIPAFDLCLDLIPFYRVAL